MFKGRPDKAEYDRLLAGADGVDKGILSAAWRLGVNNAIQHAESQLSKAAKTGANEGLSPPLTQVSAADGVIDFRGYVFGAYDSVKKALAEIDTDRVLFRINSWGGSLFEGAAIYNLLRQDKRPVDTVAMGIAGSAASVIFMAGENRTVGGAASVMIHDASTIAMGNPTQLRTVADFLDSVSDGMAELYAERAGGTKAEWRERMSYDNFMTGSDAVETGLATAAGDADAPEPKADPEPEPEPEPKQKAKKPAAKDKPKPKAKVVISPSGMAYLRTE